MWYLAGYNAQRLSIKTPFYICMDHVVFYSISAYLFPKRQIVDSSKLREFADDNFKFGENDGKFFKWLENTMGKGEIARYEQFLLFPRCFQKICLAGT